MLGNIVFHKKAEYIHKTQKGGRAMSMKKIPLRETDGLSKFIEEGSQGIIYILPPDKLIKIYQYDDVSVSNITSARLEALGKDPGIYDSLKHFCAIPEALVQRHDNGQIVGFQMKHFQDFEPISILLSKPFCVKNKLTIRKIIHIFLSIHDCLRKIHESGFMIGDFNEDNVMFKFADKTVLLAFVDVDSWAVRKSNLSLPASAKTHSFCHPETERDIRKLETHHDWYSFAVLLARSLVKANPFNLGSLDDKTMQEICGTSQEKGITCWDKRILLTKDEIMYTKRFGKELTSTLEKWLQGNQQGIFPKEVLEKFLDGLAMCKGDNEGKQCTLEVHIDHINCTKCGEKLPQPYRRTNEFRKSKQESEPSSDILSRLLRSGG